MPKKLGNGGYSQETYDPNTGKYVEDGKENKYYDNPDENKSLNSLEINTGFDTLGKWKDEWHSFFVPMTPEEKAQEFADSETRAIAEKYGFDLIETEHSARQDAAVINPNRIFSKDYRTNCVSCAICYELRRRGIDVEAKGSDIFLRTNYTISNWWNDDEYSKVLVTKDGRDAKWNNFNITRRDSAMQIITDTLSKYPDGTRFFMRCGWTSHSGHAFNAEIVDGEVKIIDGQVSAFNEELYINKLIRNAMPSSFSYIVANDAYFQNDSLIADVIKLAAKKKEKGV